MFVAAAAGAAIQGGGEREDKTGSRQLTIDPWRPAQSVDDDEKAPRRVNDKVLEESEGVRACSRRVSQPEWATQQRKLAPYGCACVRACASVVGRENS